MARQKRLTTYNLDALLRLTDLFFAVKMQTL